MVGGRTTTGAHGASARGGRLRPPPTHAADGADVLVGVGAHALRHALGAAAACDQERQRGVGKEARGASVSAACATLQDRPPQQASQTTRRRGVARSPASAVCSPTPTAAARLAASARERAILDALELRWTGAQQWTQVEQRDQQLALDGGGVSMVVPPQSETLRAEARRGIARAAVAVAGAGAAASAHAAAHGITLLRAPSRRAGAYLQCACSTQAAAGFHARSPDDHFAPRRDAPQLCRRTNPLAILKGG